MDYYKDMLGFSFKGYHSKNFKIGVKSLNRTLLPEARKNEFVIPGQHGTLELGDITYEKRQITMEITLVQNADWGKLRQDARDLARWLTGSGRLIFDDEPDKMYNASVYDAVDIEQWLLMPVGTCEIVFDCQPFAESPDYRQAYLQNIEDNNATIPLAVRGTVETCCIITVKNIGTEDIKNLMIRRKAEI